MSKISNDFVNIIHFFECPNISLLMYWLTDFEILFNRKLCQAKEMQISINTNSVTPIHRFFC